MNLELSQVTLPLAHFTLEVNTVLSGGVVGIFGASGSGKTSLLEIIAGIRRPATGSVRLDGVEFAAAAARRHVRPEHRAVGYVPQEGALFPHLSVRQNLLYGFRGPRADLSGGAGPGRSFDHVVGVLEITGITDRRIDTLSGGEKQRVALGRALLAAPRLLLLDEPLGGLDLPLRNRVLPYLARIRAEFAIPMIYVSHSPEEMVALCDHVLVLDAGRLQTEGTPTQIFVLSSATHYERRDRNSAV